MIKISNSVDIINQKYKAVLDEFKKYIKEIKKTILKDNFDPELLKRIERVEELFNTKDEKGLPVLLLELLEFNNTSLLKVIQKISEIKKDRTNIADEKDSLEKDRKLLESSINELEVAKNQFYREKQSYEMDVEKQEVVGVPPIERCLLFIEKIKGDIKPTYQERDKIIEAGMNYNDLDEISKKILKTQESIIFKIEDGKRTQQYVNKALKELTVLYSKAQSKSSENESCYRRCLGLFKILHFSIDPFENVIRTKNNSISDIRRLFSALESTIVVLSPLDLQTAVTTQADQVIRDFMGLMLESKRVVINKVLIPDFVADLPMQLLPSLFNQISLRISFNPQQIAYFIDKMEKENPHNREKFIQILGTMLTSSEKEKIASSELAKLKEELKERMKEIDSK